MTKPMKMEVKEETNSLKSLLKSADDNLKPRIKMLISFKSAKNGQQKDMALRETGVTYATLIKWMKIYKSGGMSALMQIKSKGQPRFHWPPEAKKDLEKRLASGPYLNYKNMHKVMRKEHGLKISLPTLYKYVREDFSDLIKAQKVGRFPKIKESMEDLRSAYNFALPRIKPRIELLMLLKKGDIYTIGDLTRRSGSSFMRIRACFNLYRKGGLEAVEKSQAGPYKSVITPEAHIAIKNYLKRNPRVKLAVLHRWMKKNYLPKLEYVTLHSHVRKHIFGERKYIPVKLRNKKRRK
jgi:transposase